MLASHATNAHISATGGASAAGGGASVVKRAAAFAATWRAIEDRKSHEALGISLQQKIAGRMSAEQVHLEQAFAAAPTPLGDSGNGRAAAGRCCMLRVVVVV